jgi:hypothetical protein
VGLEGVYGTHRRNSFAVVKAYAAVIFTAALSAHVRCNLKKFSDHLSKILASGGGLSWVVSGSRGDESGFAALFFCFQVTLNLKWSEL